MDEVWLPLKAYAPNCCPDSFHDILGTRQRSFCGSNIPPSCLAHPNFVCVANNTHLMPPYPKLRPGLQSPSVLKPSLLPSSMFIGLFPSLSNPNILTCIPPPPIVTCDWVPGHSPNLTTHRKLFVARLHTIV
ncbi:hypothetical protein JAAARDRAFT_33849 [Jaapia argillacea MUCL 33604]|uniref:Uncharacterized protein n=1 Tax=Jaapia argillacea MUCL 33604 TaxID=933084 RepID=A0A067PYZ0_9AGAM|nr:hypothetical protein JAAARDRAFT_33849 [Jaapia argillacea MUCL 33604]